uniref:Uncharacterized protein n=1 Tax=Arundo donax TaxID=35708 RepID=A0A0A8XYL0_ARUDO
MLMLLRFFW